MVQWAGLQALMLVGSGGVQPLDDTGRWGREWKGRSLSISLCSLVSLAGVALFYCGSSFLQYWSLPWSRQSY